MLTEFSKNLLNEIVYPVPLSLELVILCISSIGLRCLLSLRELERGDRTEGTKERVATAPKRNSEEDASPWRD